MDVGTKYACMYSLCCRTISKPTSYAETQWENESAHVHRMHQLHGQIMNIEHWFSRHNHHTGTRAKSLETTSQNHTMNKHGPIKDIG